MKLRTLTAKYLVVLLFCGATSAYSAKLDIQIFGADGKPIENAVIYLDHFPQDETDHPAEAVMDQHDKNFAPHVMVVPLGTQVNFSNTDTVNHYVYSFSEPKKFQIKLFKDEKKPHQIIFDQLGLITLGCNIHDFMLGYILVVPNHFFSFTDAQGVAQMTVPDQTNIIVKVWHERANENLDLLAQSVSILSPSTQLQIKLRKPLKATRRTSHSDNDY